MNKYGLQNIAVLLGMITFLMSGCAAAHNMAGSEYRQELVPDSQTYFSQVWAVADDDEFRISGRLRLKGGVGTNVPDFVEVTLVDESGKTIERREIAYYPTRLADRRKYRQARFTTVFDQLPAAGTVIRLAMTN